MELNSRNKFVLYTSFPVIECRLNTDQYNTRLTRGIPQCLWCHSKRWQHYPKNIRKNDPMVCY